MNIARLVMLYVKKFEICCVDEAVHYFFLLNKLNNLDGVNVYSKCVSDLVQETKQYERLFGKMQKNNMRSKGLLDQLKTADIPVEKLAQQVGEELQDKALFEDAIDLYDLAQVLLAPLIIPIFSLRINSFLFVPEPKSSRGADVHFDFSSSSVGASRRFLARQTRSETEKHCRAIRTRRLQKLRSQRGGFV